jgi:hypothetical protein
MPQDEPDINNFSTSSSHRLPTLSGTQALQHELRRARGISTNLPGVDGNLLPNAVKGGGVGSQHVPASSLGFGVGAGAAKGGLSSGGGGGGVRKGVVTEFYGPPGVGKTTVGMQLAVNAIRDAEGEGGDGGGKVVWISTGKPLVKERLVALYSSSTLGRTSQEAIGNDAESKALGDEEIPSSPPLPIPPPPSTEQIETHLSSKITYIPTTSIPHLLTLLLHPTPLFPPPNTSLLIIDDLSNLLNSAFPRTRPPPPSIQGTTNPLRPKPTPSTHRRFNVLDALSTALPRLAASRHIALVLLNSASTSLKQGQRAVLKPGLSGQNWEGGVNTRVVLYRDFAPEGIAAPTAGGMEDDRGVDGGGGYRVAAVVKVNGRDVWREGVGFTINEDGLREVPSGAVPSAQPATGVGVGEVEASTRGLRDTVADYTPLKRKADAAWLSELEHEHDKPPRTDTGGQGQGQLEMQGEADADADADPDFPPHLPLPADPSPNDLSLNLPLRSSSPIQPPEVFQRASQIHAHESAVVPGVPDEETDVGGNMGGNIGTNMGGNMGGDVGKNRKRKVGEIADSEDEDEEEMLV